MGLIIDQSFIKSPKSGTRSLGGVVDISNDFYFYKKGKHDIFISFQVSSATEQVDEDLINRVQKRDKIIEYNKTCQNIINWIQINNLFKKIHLQGFVIKDTKVMSDYLNKNQFLASTINDTIESLLIYFSDKISNIYLDVKYDPEEENDGILYIKVKTILNPLESFMILRKFKTEWFIPKLGDKILRLNIDFI